MSEHIEPGDGWRLLGPDEVVREGDEFCAFNSFVWEEVAESFIGEKGQSTRIRRRIPAKPEPDGVLFYEWRVENEKAVMRIDMERAEFNAKQARQLADWLTRYADWREAQEAAK